MIFLKVLIVLASLIFGYVCVRLLWKSNRELDRTEGMPMDVVTDLDRPRSQLIKTIDGLRSENEELRRQLKELQNKN